MLVLSANRERLVEQEALWRKEYGRDGIVEVNMAKLLLVSAPPPFINKKEGLLLLTNLELLQLPFVKHDKQTRLLAWLEHAIRECAPLCKATLLLSPNNERIVFKIKLLFDQVITLTYANLQSAAPALKLMPREEFWRPVIGYDGCKRELDKFIRWRFERKSSMNAMGIPTSSTSHCLLHGPSGNGKTHMARNFARLGINFHALKASQVFSKWYGESEQRIRDAFQRARDERPCILFLDEVESLAPTRANSEEGGGSGVNARVLSTLLNEMDGVDTENQDVIVLACTNAVHMVDDALLRPGRLGCLVRVDAPSAEDRELLLRHFLLHAPLLEQNDDAIAWLVNRTAQFSVLEIETMCSKAKFAALRRGSQVIETCDFI